MDAFALSEFLEAVASGAAAARLLSLGLAPTQPALLSFLLFISADLLGLSCLDARSGSYFWFYIVATVLNWFVSIWVVRELVLLALQKYPGIVTVGKWIMYSAVGLSVATAILATVFTRTGGPHGHTNLYFVQIANRSVVFTLAVAVMAVVALISRYPLHLQRNIYVSCGFFSAVFLSEAATQFINTFAPNLFFRTLDVTQILFSACCFAGWAAMLRPAPVGEPQRVTFENPQEHELLQQLETLNKLLARSTQR
jgi:hypothetical protein